MAHATARAAMWVLTPWIIWRHRVHRGIGRGYRDAAQGRVGVLADRVGNKKALALWGYGLSGFTKPLLFFAASWPLVLVVRVLDRIGKGIRTAPRDALIADVTAPEARGRAFGFNKAMDKAGAVVGLVLAAGILYVGGSGQVALTRENYQALVLLSVIPGIASVFVLARWVREGPRSASARGSSVRLAWRGLDGRFRAYLVMLVIFTLGNSSDAFLMLRAQTLGFQPVEIFLLLAGFNLVITVSSTPAGALSDRLGRRGLIVVGWVIYAVIYLGSPMRRRLGTSGPSTSAMGSTTEPSKERPAPSWPTWFRLSSAGRPTACSTGRSASSRSRPACSRASSGIGTARPRRSWPVGSSRSWRLLECSR